MHPERFDALLERTADLAKAFVGAGYQIYLVGGSVRDALLDSLRDDADLDLTTDARPDEIERLLRSSNGVEGLWSQGRDFGTIGARVGGQVFEITTHRSDQYASETRKPEVIFGDDIEVDLSRRDFTFNCMALQIPDPLLIDPYGGLNDLHAGVLKTPLAAEVSFADDPLRMMRAARFMARFNLQPTAEVEAAVVKMAERLRIVSAERIREEFDRLLVLDNPSSGLWFLAHTGLSDYFLPELNAMEVEQDPIHRHKDVLAHTIAVVEKTSAQLRLRLAALFHDVGKPKTRSVGENGVAFHFHDVVGSRMTRKRMKEMRYSTEMIDDVSRLVELHLRFHTYRLGWTDSAVRRYVRDAGDLLDDLNELVRCDCTTRNKKKASVLAGRMDELELRISELSAQEEMKRIRPQLDGRFVMSHLGLPPGRLVGEALDFLLEIRLDEGVLPEAEAVQRLDGWWKLKSST